MKKLGLFLIVVFIIGGCLFFFYHSPKSNPEPVSEKIVSSKEVRKSIFKNSYEEARKIVNKMTIEEKVGQLFLVRYEKDNITEYNSMFPGGYVLFARDFESHTKTSLKKQLEKNQENSKYPLILGVDEEGGYVTRVSRYPAFRDEKFASPKYYYDIGGIELLERTEKEKAELLKEIGLNLNLAPVADVSVNENDYIYSRSFGKDAKTTSDLIRKMVEVANENKMNSCLKHFPGYGSNVDTHKGIATDNREYNTFLEQDYLPFKAGIEAKVPCILVSHNIVTSMDKDYPSSLSSKVIKELRDTLNYTGIIITDDLAMDAVKSFVEDKKAATLAIQAGNDMIITSDFKEMYDEVLESVKENIISEDTINTAVLRIISWKLESNLFK